ncbi:nucleotidyltransferase domain-containing protein [Nocardioides sp. CBS4Y-1]|uniref:Nucleotidyltransferase domain-containing protein n=1 Tax=Nocardioides acrostichi TaxID=2784339 RepID=A0A930UYS6_9ACTN|nr:nucleotidyltransferase domain-containing protein [Nocardioides acrostichi]
MDIPPAVDALATELRRIDWVTHLLVGGSLATGDYRPGVSDLDLVAIIDPPRGADPRPAIRRVHRHLDGGVAAGAALGCAYVARDSVAETTARHPTWTHGRLVERPLSGIARIELARHGFAVLGQPPGAVFGPVSDEDVRHAALEELTGYWTVAARRPWWWLDPSIAELGLTSMARGRHALETGALLTKSAAIDVVDAPAWLRSDLRARRDGQHVRWRCLRAARIAWRDARRTTAAARACAGTRAGRR